MPWIYVLPTINNLSSKELEGTIRKRVVDCPSSRKNAQKPDRFVWASCRHLNEIETGEIRCTWVALEYRTVHVRGIGFQLYRGMYEYMLLLLHLDLVRPFLSHVIPTAALECASAEMTTKELVTEVGEEEKLLRAIEVTMTGQRPTDEVQRRAPPTAFLFYPPFAFFTGCLCSC